MGAWPLPTPAPPSLSDQPGRVRLSTPGEVLAAVPYLIGFAPQRSVVVLSLRGKQIGLTMRLDLDTPRETLHKVIVSRLAADSGTSAVLVIFDPHPGKGSHRPGASIARPLIRAVERAGVQVRDALGVCDGSFWSYLCEDPRCCPPEGRPVPVSGSSDHSKVASNFVAIGTAPMASRDELSASIAGPSAQHQHDLAPAYSLALERPSAEPLERWAIAVARYADAPARPGSGLTEGEAVRLVVSLQDNLVRDEVISWTAGAALGGVLAVLRELTGIAVPPYQTQVLATLAWAAYSSGDGAMAAIALERALAAAPRHSLAALLATCLDTGIDPSQLRAISTELSELVSDGWMSSDEC